MPADHPTLARFLAEERRRPPGVDADLAALILDVARPCTTLARRIALPAPHADVDAPSVLPTVHSRGDYLLSFDPLDAPSNVDVNLSAGSIFSILRAPRTQACAGYALYGPATTLVLTVGRGVHAFTLDPARGEFVRTREAMRVPPQAREFAIDASNRRFWGPAVRRYVDECLAGRSGPRHEDFTMHGVASLVAATHRVLTRGGVFLSPRDPTVPAMPGLRLRAAAHPVAFLIEQAGGAASTGRERVLDVVASGGHQHVPLIFGARDEVARLDHHHRPDTDRAHDWPLYGDRGLFRVATG